MKFGLPFFGLSPRHYASVARAAEDNGFESVWMPEHLVIPAEMPATYPYTESGFPPITPETPLYDPWVVLGSVASATETIRLATNVFILPLRHPIATARSVVTLDRLSGGRVTLGAGVGWLEGEFDIVGQSFADRGRRMDEIMGLLRELWTGETVEHHGEFYDVGPLTFSPKALQKPSIPIEIGGASAAALRRAGQLGDGWIEIGCKDLDELAAKMDVIREHRRQSGRQDLPFEFTAGVGTDLDTIRRAQELGVTRIVAGAMAVNGRVSVDDVRDFTARFADEVIAKL
ncbi:MAG TPA: LLM class F420-dependent oxidoreductase [Acidimicrobiales bacterium]|jgi:probable F420-dependent oxidoreductase|nr:LLM class F420-dependent oxidoreductase [Acidimicrobiales bacterium]